MNDILNQMKTRRSCRHFLEKPVPAELLDEIAQAGLYAASSRNLQSPIILQITDPALIGKLYRMNAAAAGREGGNPFYGAPALFVVLADRSAASTYLYDGSLVLGNMMLAAHALGLGSCWIHRAKEEFESEEGKEILKSFDIEGDYEGIGHLIVGYSADPLPPPPERRKGRLFVR